MSAVGSRSSDYEQDTHMPKTCNSSVSFTDTNTLQNGKFRGVMIAMTEFSSGVGKHISKCNNAHFWTRVKSQEKLREFELEIRSKLFYFCFRVWFKFRIFTRIYISALTGFGFLSSIFYFVSPYLCYDTRKNLANRCVLTTCNVKAHSEFISSDSTAFITASHHWFYNSSNFPSISSFPPWLFSFLPQSPLWPHLERKKNNIAATCQMTWPTNFMECYTLSTDGKICNVFTRLNF